MRAVEVKMAVVDSIERSTIAIVDKQVNGGICWDVVLGLRKGGLRGRLSAGACAAGYQDADFAHRGAIACQPAGAGIIAGDLPVFVGEGEALGSGGHQRGRAKPQHGGAEKRTHINPGHKRYEGNYMRLIGVRISELGERAAHSATGKTQDIFRQTLGGIDVGLAALDQQPAQTAFDD